MGGKNEDKKEKHILYGKEIYELRLSFIQYQPLKAIKFLLLQNW